MPKVALSLREQEKLADANARLRAAMSRAKQESRKAVDAGIKTGAGMGAAFGVGYIENRYPDKNKVFGIDLSLLVGVTATAVGAFGLAGDKQTNSIVEAIGNGALFAFAAKKGAQMGAEALAKA